MSDPFATLKRLSVPPLAETYTASYELIDQSLVVDVTEAVVYDAHINPIVNKGIITRGQRERLADKVTNALLACDLASYNAILIVTSCAMKSTNCYVHTVSATLYRLL